MSNRVNPFARKTTTVQSANGTKSWAPAAIPDAGAVSVVVTTVTGWPSFLVARGALGRPRTQFVDELVEGFYGRKPDGTKHEWEIEEWDAHTRLQY